MSDLQAEYEVWNEKNIPPFFPGYREYHPTIRGLYMSVSTPSALEMVN